MPKPYVPTWITRNLAVGHAPKSFEELDDLKSQGINAIINLCKEFSDLHEIERQAGFEVFYLPIDDDTAPRMEEMEAGLAWLDEAVYLGKKVLVHCHYGVGRTGTFVTAYLLRRGFGLKKAGRKLKATRATPSNFSQWWLLRKFGKKEGVLTIDEPTPENRNPVDLSEFYHRYEQLLARVDSLNNSLRPGGCCRPEAQSCGRPFSLELIEALYLHDKVNITLPSEVRQMVIARASDGDTRETASGGDTSPERECPLHQDDACILHQYRPIHCRMRDLAEDAPQIAEIRLELALLSRQVFTALFGLDLESSPPAVNCTDSVSGKFTRNYFHFLATQKKP